MTDVEPEPQPPDVSGLIKHLHAYGVRGVVVGGASALLRGAVRPTSDYDTVVAWDQDNLQRLCNALDAADARVRTSNDQWIKPPGGVDVDELRRTRSIRLTTTYGLVDVLRSIPDRHGQPQQFRDLEARADVASVDGVPILVASLDDVITSKEFDPRSKDHEALPELRRLRQAQQEPGAPPVFGRGGTREPAPLPPETPEQGFEY